MTNEELSEKFTALLVNIEKAKQAVEALPIVANNPFALSFIDDSTFCAKVSAQYFLEANKAIQAHAWFAGATVAAAALEVLLLCQCFTHHREVVALPKYSQLQGKKQRDYSHFVRSLDLGKLLEIADQLAWFPAGGVPEIFLESMRPHWGGEAGEQFSQLFQGSKNVAQLCAKYLKDYRNLLHPAVCLRERQEPTAATGMAATTMFMIATISLSSGIRVKPASADSGTR